MVIHIVRAVYLLVVLAFTVSYAIQDRIYEQGSTYVTLYILIPSVAAFGLVMLDMFWRRKRLQVLSGLFFGLLAGLVIAYVLAKIVDLSGSIFAETFNETQATSKALPTVIVHLNLPRGDVQDSQSRSTAPPAESSEQRTVAVAAPAEKRPAPAKTSMVALAKVLLGASAVFLCVSFVLQTKDDFRFVVPYVEFSRQAKGKRSVLMDTSVIIDGRIADIAETRILDSEVLVPRFVLSELQAIADSDDKLKRNRGRRGLDVLNRLQSSEKIDIRIVNLDPPNLDESAPVDAKLVALAEHLGGRIMTNDYNLNKIAQIRGVEVVNINDLANAMKPVVLPGERLNVKIIRPGEEPDQGVGYLEDGTMVVAEHGKDHVGREITITVTSVLQTSAGRMIFGKYEANRTPGKHYRNG